MSRFNENKSVIETIANSIRNIPDPPSGDRGKLYIIKIGGNVIDDEKNLHSFLKAFAKTFGANAPSFRGRGLLVHGGGKIATAIGDKLNIHSQYIDGRRITDDDTIDLVTMVYGGLINKKIVATLQGLKCNAIGLCGADGNSIKAVKRPVKAIDYGWVGDIDSSKIDTGIWQLFIDNGWVPVVASLTHDREGHILNTNADTIASALAAALAGLYEVHLIFCFEKNGVLTDVNDENSVITELNSAVYQSLKENNKLFAGILPKIDNAFDAIHKGVKEVVIGNSENFLQLINNQSGTKII
ncbi:MAG TPA: acetylglutamate kinase [Chitinophagaceae bacterium]|nr:acetylglutamate kinase [Chitinophagaceae bacterium]